MWPLSRFTLIAVSLSRYFGLTTVLRRTIPSRMKIVLLSR